MRAVRRLEFGVRGEPEGGPTQPRSPRDERTPARDLAIDRNPLSGMDAYEDEMGGYSELSDRD
jgi:hypothetical protein